MQVTDNPRAIKKPANLSINADLLNKAKEMNINLSATLERALVETLKDKQRTQWLQENKAAIEAYNNYVDQHGVFSDELRSF